MRLLALLPRGAPLPALLLLARRRVLPHPQLRRVQGHAWLRDGWLVWFGIQPVLGRVRPFHLHQHHWLRVAGAAGTGLGMQRRAACLGSSAGPSQAARQRHAFTPIHPSLQTGGDDSNEWGWCQLDTDPCSPHSGSPVACAAVLDAERGIPICRYQVKGGGGMGMVVVRPAGSPSPPSPG